MLATGRCTLSLVTVALPPLLTHITTELVEHGRDEGIALGLALNAADVLQRGSALDGRRLSGKSESSARRASDLPETLIEGLSPAVVAAVEKTRAAKTLPTPEERIQIVESASHRHTILEGLAMALRSSNSSAREKAASHAGKLLGEGDGDLARRVADTIAAYSLIEEAMVCVSKRTPGSSRSRSRSLAAAPSSAGATATAADGAIVEAAPPVVGRSGQPVNYSESKHPRVGKGRHGGGQFAHGQGGQGQGAQAPSSQSASLQRRLRTLGYDVSVSGRDDPKTSSSLADFQKQQNLPPTGKLDPSTIEALRNPAPLTAQQANAELTKGTKGTKKVAAKKAATKKTTLTDPWNIGKGEKGPKVAALQDSLGEFGFNIGDAYGTFDKDTEESVRRFQKQVGIQPTGKMDSITRTALLTANAKSKSDTSVFGAGALQASERAAGIKESAPPLPDKPGINNWVEKAGGLPNYIDRIARHLHWEKGMSTSHAIATAVNVVKRWCFPPETLVRTEDGYRPIEQVVVGDRVVGGDGHLHEVTDVSRRDWEGPLTVIATGTTPDPIRATPSHPFLQMTSAGADWTLAAMLEEGDYLIQGDLGATCDLDFVDVPEHLRYERVRVRVAAHREELALAVAGGERKVDAARRLGVSRQAIGQMLTRCEEGDAPPREYNGAKLFELTPDFLWVVGLYLAEGSGGQALSFSLHAGESSYAERIRSVFEPLGYRVTISRPVGRESEMQVRVFSRMLGAWFEEWLGHGCANKRIPGALLNLPIEKAQHLLDGILAGDGGRDKGGTWCLGQTSRTLALQVMELSRRLGGQPTLWTSQRENRKRVYTVYGAAGGVRADGRSRRGFKRLPDGRLGRAIQSISMEWYEGPVYNLEVEDAHSYVVEGLAVHNCVGGTVSTTHGPTVTNHVTAKTRAEACAAVAQWEAMRAATKAGKAARAVSHAISEAEELIRQARLDGVRPPSLEECAEILEAVEAERAGEIEEYVFEPSKHPRDPLGKFTAALWNLRVGKTVLLSAEENPTAVTRLENITGGKHDRYKVYGGREGGPEVVMGMNDVAAQAMERHYGADVLHPSETPEQKRERISAYAESQLLHQQHREDVVAIGAVERHPKTDEVGSSKLKSKTVREATVERVEKLESRLQEAVEERQRAAASNDAEAFTQARAREQALRSQIEEGVFWKPELHPRNRTGMFRDVLGKLEIGQAITFHARGGKHAGKQMKVVRTAKGFEVNGEPSGLQSATDRLDISFNRMHGEGGLTGIDKTGGAAGHSAEFERQSAITLGDGIKHLDPKPGDDALIARLKDGSYTSADLDQLKQRVVAAENPGNDRNRRTVLNNLAIMVNDSRKRVTGGAPAAPWPTNKFFSGKGLLKGQAALDHLDATIHLAGALSNGPGLTAEDRVDLVKATSALESARHAKTYSEMRAAADRADSALRGVKTRRAGITPRLESEIAKIRATPVAGGGIPDLEADLSTGKEIDIARPLPNYSDSDLRVLKGELEAKGDRSAREDQLLRSVGLETNRRAEGGRTAMAGPAPKFPKKAPERSLNDQLDAWARGEGPKPHYTTASQEDAAKHRVLLASPFKGTHTYQPGIMDMADPNVIEGEPIRKDVPVRIVQGGPGQKKVDPAGKIVFVQDDKGNVQSVWKRGLTRGTSGASASPKITDWSNSPEAKASKGRRAANKAAKGGGETTINAGARELDRRRGTETAAKNDQRTELETAAKNLKVGETHTIGDHSITRTASGYKTAGPGVKEERHMSAEGAALEIARARAETPGARKPPSETVPGGAAAGVYIPRDEELIQRRVRGGFNEAESRELLAQLRREVSDKNLPSALANRGFIGWNSAAKMQSGKRPDWDETTSDTVYQKKQLDDFFRAEKEREARRGGETVPGGSAPGTPSAAKLEVLTGDRRVAQATIGSMKVGDTLETTHGMQIKRLAPGSWKVTGHPNGSKESHAATPALALHMLGAGESDLLQGKTNTGPGKVVGHWRSKRGTYEAKLYERSDGSFHYETTTGGSGTGGGSLGVMKRDAAERYMTEHVVPYTQSDANKTPMERVKLEDNRPGAHPDAQKLGLNSDPKSVDLRGMPENEAFVGSMEYNGHKIVITEPGALSSSKGYHVYVDDEISDAYVRSPEIAVEVAKRKIDGKPSKGAAAAVLSRPGHAPTLENLPAEIGHLYPKASSEKRLKYQQARSEAVGAAGASPSPVFTEKYRAAVDALNAVRDEHHGLTGKPGGETVPGGGVGRITPGAAPKADELQARRRKDAGHSLAANLEHFRIAKDSTLLTNLRGENWEPRDLDRAGAYLLSVKEPVGTGEQSSLRQARELVSYMRGLQGKREAGGGYVPHAMEPHALGTHISNAESVSVTDTAKLVRDALKRKYPDTKFSVKSSKYSMGASIDVSYKDGPPKAEVDAFVGRYSSKGAMDNTDYSPDLQHVLTTRLDGSHLVRPYKEGEKLGPNDKIVRFGSHYVNAQRSGSPEKIATGEATPGSKTPGGWTLDRVGKDGKRYFRRTRPNGAPEMLEEQPDGDWSHLVFPADSGRSSRGMPKAHGLKKDVGDKMLSGEYPHIHHQGGTWSPAKAAEDFKPGDKRSYYSGYGQGSSNEVLKVERKGNVIHHTLKGENGKEHISKHRAGTPLAYEPSSASKTPEQKAPGKSLVGKEVSLTRKVPDEQIPSLNDGHIKVTSEDANAWHGHLVNNPDGLELRFPKKDWEHNPSFRPAGEPLVGKYHDMSNENLKAQKTKDLQDEEQRLEKMDREVFQGKTLNPALMVRRDSVRRDIHRLFHELERRRGAGETGVFTDPSYFPEVSTGALSELKASGVGDAKYQAAVTRELARRVVAMTKPPALKHLTTEDRHQISVARRVLATNPAIGKAMGGISRQEASDIIMRLTGKRPLDPFGKIKEAGSRDIVCLKLRLEEAVSARQAVAARFNNQAFTTARAIETEIRRQIKESGLDIAEATIKTTSKPWDGSAGRFTDAQYQVSSLIDRGPKAGSVKERCSLPVLEPDGTLNTNALGAAAGRLNQLANVTPAAKAAAAAKLARLRVQAGAAKETPEMQKLAEALLD